MGGSEIIDNRLVPKIGEYYHFWDDGKTAVSRHYICKCEKIIPFDKINEINIDGVDFYKVWEKQVNYCTWLFAKETDYIIVCSCPKYDDDVLYFTRTLDGGWFSLDITSSWQGGRLDIGNKIFDNVIGVYNYLDIDQVQLYENQTY